LDLATFLAEQRTYIPEGQIALRLTLATLFGAVVGLDRELRNHAAGLRTHMLTAAAAAVFTVLTLELHQQVRAEDGGRITADPIRVVEAVTAGVAFLAAGAIIHGRGTVRGLTTGAGMWLAGAIGVACGTGRFSIALMALVLAMLVLSAFHLLEHRWVSPDRPQGRSDADPPGRPPNQPPRDP